MVVGSPSGGVVVGSLSGGVVVKSGSPSGEWKVVLSQVLVGSDW